MLRFIRHQFYDEGNQFNSLGCGVLGILQTGGLNFLQRLTSFALHLLRWKPQPQYPHFHSSLSPISVVLSHW